MLLTGHTGFKGAWLAHWLLQLGAIPAGYALPPNTTPSLFQLAGLAEEMESVEADVRDLRALETVFSRFRPEIVMHLAAQPLVAVAYEDPATTLSTNVMGTVNVLECVRRLSSVGATLVVTSDKCYDLGEGTRRHTEDDRLGGNDPYSVSKACAELVVAAHRRSFGAALSRVATARAGNVIGGGDWSRGRIIPDAVRAFTAKRQLVLRKPLAIRPWQHVLDPLRGYLLLVRALYESGTSFAEAWNFGPPESNDITVSALVTRFVQAWGDHAAWVAAEGEQFYEEPVLRLDSEKAAKHLGWRAQVELGDALDAIARWYKAQNEGVKSQNLMAEELQRWGNGNRVVAERKDAPESRVLP